MTATRRDRELAVEHGFDHVPDQWLDIHDEERGRSTGRCDNQDRPLRREGAEDGGGRGTDIGRETQVIASIPHSEALGTPMINSPIPITNPNAALSAS